MRQLTIERAAFIILFALLFALATRIPIDSDTWWHIRSGEHTLTQGMIYNDPFSFSMNGKAWVNHGWGSQLIMLGFWKVAGNLGLAVYTSLLATAGMYMVFRMSAGNVYLRALAVVISAATAAVFWSARPQMLSFFLSTVVLYILYQYKREKVDRLWLLPVIMLVWGNLHAGFSIGYICMLGTIGGEVLANIFNPQGEYTIRWDRLRKLIIVTIIAVLALVINPYGLGMFAVPFETLGIGALRDFIQEWNSPNFHERQTWPFVVLLIGTLGAVGASNKRLEWSDFVLFSFWTFMSLYAGRNISVLAVVATPILTYHLDAILTERGWVLQTIKRPTRMMVRINAALVILLVLGALAKVLVVLDSETVVEAQSQFLPVKATEYFNAEHIGGPMLNSYNWGGYLILNAPQELVFADGRTDLYGNDFLQAYMEAALGGDNWREILDEYAIQTVFVESQSGLARRLRDESGWTIRYEDDVAVIFTQDGSDG